jgi:ketosteroid isomerase-like protein
LEFMASAFADTSYSLNWEPARAELSASGDLGFTIGRYQSRRMDADGQPIVRTGTYLSIWRREESGAWKVVVDTGVPDPEP